MHAYKYFFGKFSWAVSISIWQGSNHDLFLSFWCVVKFEKKFCSNEANTADVLPAFSNFPLTLGCTPCVRGRDASRHSHGTPRKLLIISKCLRYIHSKYFENTVSTWKSMNMIEEKCWLTWRNFQENTWHVLPSCPLQKQSLPLDLVYESWGFFGFLFDKANLIGFRELNTNTSNLKLLF